MTDGQTIMSPTNSPAILLLELPANSREIPLYPYIKAGLTVRSVRGSKMKEDAGLFDELSAALQFPDYFGENWAALDECLNDLDWLAAQIGVAILVKDPGKVLSANTAKLEWFVEIIDRAARTFSQPISLGEFWDRPALPFHVVLQTTSETRDDVTNIWQAAGAHVDALTRVPVSD